MRDRTPTQVLDNGALRYGVYDEAGNLLRYEYLALEDDPTDPGTDLSKATLLQDSTEVSLFGSAADRTVDDAFSNIAGRLKLIMSDSAEITLTLQDSGGHGLPGVLVQGILSESGAAIYSNASGVAAGYIGEGSQVIKISGYADIEDYTETLTVVKGTTITKTLTLTTRDFLKVTSSGNVKFSGNVESIDHSIVGGGGGGQGGDSWNIASGSGGWAGSVTNTNGVEVEANVLYPAVIGSGGSPGAGSDQQNGGAGGDSQFMGKTATGGSGGSSTSTGTGNAKGGAGQNAASLYGGRQGNPGTDGSMQTFKNFSEMEIGPGGGGGGAVGNYGSETTSASGGAGGRKDGAMGGSAHPKQSPSAPKPAPNNSGAGGGGGAGCRYYNSDGERQNKATSGSKGGSGFIAIRMHLKSAA